MDRSVSSLDVGEEIGPAPCGLHDRYHRASSATNITVFVMGVCVRVRVARVVRVSESALLTLDNTLCSSEKP